MSFRKYFAPLLNIIIEEHISQVSCEIRPLEKGIDLIILWGRFMVEHSMSFKGNNIQVKPHICDPESIISHNETLLDDEEVV
jgi:hypothetical protein